MLNQLTKDKVFIVAELSANHNQKKDIAIESIRAAKKAGADAIKLQTYKADTITIDCDSEYFQIKNGLWKGMTLYKLYNETYTPWEWHEELFSLAKKEGLVCFSSPFDKTAVDFLETLETPIYKLASPEITDIPLIRYIASKQKSIILSSGISRFEDIQFALETIRHEGNNDIAILKCTSTYPTSPEEANLATISSIKETFNVIPGLSDHTLGILAPVVAVSQGAKIIEKHFIIDRSFGGPDAAFSLNYKEFGQMVESIRIVEKLIGKVNYELTPKLEKIRKQAARSLFVVKNIKAGELFTEENVKSIRPGHGLHPKYLDRVINQKAKVDILRGTPLEWKFIN